MITVVNKRTHLPTKNDFYIGRGSPLGNPFTSKPLANTRAQFQAESVEDSIQKYEKWLLDNLTKEKRDYLNKIWLAARKGNVNLVCYCAPGPCHGDIIKDWIEKTLKRI